MRSANRAVANRAFTRQAGFRSASPKRLSSKMRRFSSPSPLRTRRTSPRTPAVCWVESLSERTMMLLAPRLAICSWALRLIPSPIASSQMTLAVPMKIPSTVSSERSGCKSKLLVPNRQVRSQKKFMGKTEGCTCRSAIQGLPPQAIDYRRWTARFLPHCPLPSVLRPLLSHRSARPTE